MTNFEVAEYLLKVGLSTMEGVVFLDEEDRKMILLRSGKVMKLEQCGVPMARRFSFYDQVHTTGMDIKQSPNARAVVTIGKDMTFRDYAQGAYRMRGIGVGQTITLYLIPEVVKRMQAELTAQECARPEVAVRSSAASRRQVLAADAARVMEVLVAAPSWCAAART